VSGDERCFLTKHGKPHSVSCPTIYTSQSRNLFSMSDHVLFGSSEDTIREDALRRRKEKDRLRREMEIPEERDARFKSCQNKPYMFIEISIYNDWPFRIEMINISENILQVFIVLRRHFGSRVRISKKEWKTHYACSIEICIILSF